MAQNMTPRNFIDGHETDCFAGYARISRQKFAETATQLQHDAASRRPVLLFRRPNALAPAAGAFAPDPHGVLWRPHAAAHPPPERRSSAAGAAPGAGRSRWTGTAAAAAALDFLLVARRRHMVTKRAASRDNAARRGQRDSDSAASG